MNKKILKIVSCFLIIICLSAFGKWYSNRYFTYHPEVEVQIDYCVGKLSKYSFAGEPLPFNDAKMLSKYAFYHKKNLKKSKSTNVMVRNALLWLPEFDKIFRKNQIPTDFKYLVVAESNVSNIISPKGAAGFWQIIPSTGIEIGLEINEEVDERYNAIKSTQAVCKYFKRAYKHFGNWTDVAVSYNAGIQKIKDRKLKYGDNSSYYLNLSKESDNYIFKIISAKNILSDPEAHGFKNSPMPSKKVKTLRVRESISDLRLFASRKNIDYYTFRELNPWLRGQTLTIKEGGINNSYLLILPQYKISDDELPLASLSK